MIDLKKITKTKVSAPPKILIYGEPGVGKTTFSTSAPKSILFNIEKGGADRIECFRMFQKEPETLQEIAEAINALIEQDHDFKWIAVDTIDWLEMMLMDEICRVNKVARIDALAYGKGYQIMLEYWQRFIKKLEELQEKRKMGVILIAHDQITQVRDPLTDPYDRHSLALNKNSANIITQWVEEIGFVHKELAVVTYSENFGQKKKKAISENERIISFDPCNESYLSKTRIGMPAKIALDWAEFEKHLYSKLIEDNKKEKKNG